MRSQSTTLARLAAIGFFLNGALHTSAITQVSNSAATASKEMGQLVPLLWLSYSVAIFLLGAIVWLHARPGAARRTAVLMLAGFFPLVTAAGQFVAFGWIFPEATLGITAALTFAAAFATPPPAAAA